MLRLESIQHTVYPSGPEQSRPHTPAQTKTSRIAASCLVLTFALEHFTDVVFFFHQNFRLHRVEPCCARNGPALEWGKVPAALPSRGSR